MVLQKEEEIVELVRIRKAYVVRLIKKYLGAPSDEDSSIELASYIHPRLSPSCSFFHHLKG